MRVRVLVYEYLSGGGSGLGDEAAAAALMRQGLAMRDAMVADLVALGDCSVSVASCLSGDTLPAAVTAVRPRAGESAVDFVARQSRRHDLVWLVAPETDGLLARLQASVGDARWLGCSATAIVLASSKRATLAHLAAQGVATPLAFEQDAGAGRWVVKPDDGAGAVDTRVHASRDAALHDHAQRQQAGASVTLEPWVDGEALSLSLLCGERHTELLSVNRQQITVDAQGWVAFDGVLIHAIGGDDARMPALAALAAAVGRAIPGLSGFAGIDLVWHAQRGPVVIEVNPRVTCAYAGLSAALGRQLGAELLAQRLGLPAGHPEPAHVPA